MFKLDDNFLTELGLGSLPATEKNKMLAHIYETLEMKVGMRLAEKMSNEQLDEFEGFINQNDEAGALKWLETNFPNYKQVVAEELEKLKAEIKQVAPQIIAQAAATIQPGSPVAQPQPVAAYPQSPASQDPSAYPPYQPQVGMPPQSATYGAPNPAPMPPPQQSQVSWQPPQQQPAYPPMPAPTQDFSASQPPYGGGPPMPAYPPTTPMSAPAQQQPAFNDPYAPPQQQPAYPSYDPMPPPTNNGRSDFGMNNNNSAPAGYPAPQSTGIADNGFGAAPTNMSSANDFSNPQPLPMHDAVNSTPTAPLTTPIANQPPMTVPAMPPSDIPQQQRPADPYTPPPAEPYQPPR